MIQKIIEKTGEYRPRIAQFLKDIVSIPSFSCEEGDVVKRILTEMTECGFEDVHADALGNAVGRIGSGKTVILYDAHIDVVGIGDPNSWTHPPFPATEADGRIMGRGSVDEKPAMACMIWGGRIMKEFGLLGDFTLYVVGSVMEEDCDGYPLLHLIEKEGIRPDYVVLGEPTDLNVYRGHRGRMEIILRTRGRSAHGAHAHRGENAVYKMAPIITAIEKLNANLAHDDFLGKGSITIAKVESTSPSLCSVADSCTIYLDRRMTVGETKETVLAELRAIAPGAEIEVPVYEAVSWKGYPATQEKVFPTWVLPAEHVLVEAAKETADLFIQPGCLVSRWHFSTNGVATMGRLGIPTIGFAPGKEELSHSTDEFVEIDDLVTATRFFTLFPDYLAEKLKKQ
jgi:putative selenium metabolism hydrolase